MKYPAFMMTMTSDFKVEFGGDSHEIDLATLTTSLVSFGLALQEIQQQIDPEARLDIKVRPPERGSFLIDLVLSAPDSVSSAFNMFTRENVSLADNLISILSNMLGLKQHLNGEPPQSVTPNQDGLTLNVENNYGTIMIIQEPTYKLLDEHPKIDKLLTTAFSAIEKDESIDNVKILDKAREVLADIENDQFEFMAAPVRTSAPKEKRTIIKSGVEIFAYRLSFEEGAKWGFVYEGQKISAAMTDPAFRKAIEDQEAFAKGDIFKVDLSVSQEYDPTVRNYLNTGYEVVKVLEHRRPEISRQVNLFGDDDGG